jgi:hypothetical protein
VHRSVGADNNGFQAFNDFFNHLAGWIKALFRLSDKGLNGIVQIFVVKCSVYVNRVEADTACRSILGNILGNDSGAVQQFLKGVYGSAVLPKVCPVLAELPSVAFMK